MDHRSPEACERSAVFLLKLAKNIDPGVPIFITGDFNTNKSSSPYQILVNDGPFHDLWDVACKKENEHLGTLNLFQDVFGGGPEQRIDWILAKGSMMVQSIKIINTQYGDHPSDHFPVLTNVMLTNFE